ncbi:MAG: glycosyltransferase family 2 protein [Ferruginibacter sp.]|nr:glycosyltransferase family 2 protein [Ferruginibacter sp.]
MKHLHLQHTRYKPLIKAIDRKRYNKMKGFSIVICCYNSQNKIIETLEHIALLEAENILLEVLVIDNGSNDLTKIKADEFLKNTVINYTILEEPKIGKANALMLGCDSARYDKMIVCDDDVLLNSDYLVVADKIYSDHPGIGILGGRGKLKTGIQTPDWFDIYGPAFAIGRQWGCSGDITSQKGYIWGAGSIINKKAWADIKNNGFTIFYTGLKAGNRAMAGEDAELGVWVVDAGYQLYYLEELVYIHNISIDRINWSYLLQLQIGFSRSQVYLNFLKAILDCRRNKRDFNFNKYISDNIKLNFQSITYGFFSVNYFKSWWISYMMHRVGYVKTIQQNDGYYKIKEYLLNRKTLKFIYNSIKLS